MIDFDTTALEALRDKKPAKGKQPWAPLQLSSLHPGTYLAADQSLNAFGLVLFEVSPERACAVHLAETFSIGKLDVGGHEETLQRVEQLEDQLTRYVDRWVRSNDWGLVAAVHEMPPRAIGKMSRPEVSLLTAFAWRNATREFSRLPMVGRQQHAKLLCGDGNVKDKKVYHDKLRELFPQIRGSDLVTNEGKRDALALAIYAAHRGF